MVLRTVEFLADVDVAGVGGDDLDHGVVVAEGTVVGDVVEHEQVDALALEFGPCVIEGGCAGVTGLGCESDDDLLAKAGLPTALVDETAQDVRV